MLRSLRILVLSLGVLGFLFQSLASGTGAGLALCIGCERTWWTVSPPCDPGNGIDCCDEDEADGDAPGHQQSAHGLNECGCIDVPLPDHTTIAVAATRIDLTGTLAAFQSVPMICPVWSWNLPAAMTSWARAGPRSPPRLLLPQSRCTVLVI